MPVPAVHASRKILVPESLTRDSYLIRCILCFRANKPWALHAPLAYYTVHITREGKIMKISMRSLLPALVLSVAGLIMANSAQAACGFEPSTLKPNAWNPSTQASPTLQSAYYRAGAGGRFLLTGDEGGWPGAAGLVGMWRFQLVSPVAGVVDYGYAQWHSDGTEIQNSGVHAPDTGNFCLGVWQQVGPNKYQLNHFPLAWTGTTGGGGTNVPANAIQLTETVKLTDENHMTGTFTLKVYVWTSTDSLDVAPSMPVATVTGTVTATRVTINSTVPGSTE